MRSSAVFFGLAAGLFATAALAQPNLVPHRAVYDLVLGNSSDRSGITGLQGRMVYEFNGSPCEGYTVNFRYVTKIVTRDATRVMDQQTTTFEDGGGKNFDFVTKSFVDQNLDKELRGNATAEPDSLVVKLTKPTEQTVDLQKTQFPTQHILEIIGKAEKGPSFFETNLYDASEDGDKVMTTTVVIGKETAPKADDVEVKADQALLSKESYWPVEVAYFDLKGKATEDTPQYRTSFKLHKNGLTRDLVMDYGDFAMKGTLVNLSLLPAPKPCN